MTTEGDAWRRYIRRCRLCHETLTRSTESLIALSNLCTRCHNACVQILRWQQLGTQDQAWVVVDVLRQDQQSGA